MNPSELLKKKRNPPLPVGASSPFRPPADFWRHNKKALWRLVGVSLARAVMVAMVFYLVRQVMQNIQHQQSPAAWQLGVIILMAAGLVFMRRVERWTAENMGQRHINRIRRVVLKRLYRTSVRDIGRFSIGALTSRLGGDLTLLRRWFSLGFSRLISNTILILVSVSLVAWISPSAALVAALALALSLTVSLWLGQRLQDHLKRTRRARIRLNASLLERLQHMPAIRALGQESRELKRLDRLGDSLEKEVTHTGAVLGAMRGMGEASGILLMVAVFIAWQWFGRDLPPADVAALFSLVLFLATPVRELGRVQEYYRGACLSLAKIEELMALPRVVRGRSRQTRELPKVGTVSLKNVYLGNTLRGFSAQAGPGEKVAVIGPNGSGKSTLQQVILGLIKADKGTVRLHGVNPLCLHPVAKARNTGAFGPDLGLLRTSLRRNIAYRLDRVDEGELQHVVSYCDLEKLVRVLPKGLDSLITDQSGNVSSGEQARIALARAIIGQPAVLLLDEPESHLDKQGLKLVHHLLQTYPGTIIVSTHSPELVSLCDQTWSMVENRASIINLNTVRHVSEQ